MTGAIHTCSLACVRGPSNQRRESMMKRTPRLVLASLGVVAAAVVVAGAGATGPGADAVVAKPAPFTVASTLKGKNLLPRRIRWVASASLPPAQIRDVEFSI